MRKLAAILIALCFLGTLSAQLDYSWKTEYPSEAWKWAHYIQMVPSKMGPNALPVPQVHEARVLSQREVVGGYSYHGYKLGDAPTSALYTRFYFPVAKGRVGLEIKGVMREWYSYSKEVAYDFHSKELSGNVGGDIYVNTYLQLLKQEDRKVDLMLRYCMRTASGSDVENARYTDAPGYTFDLAAAKDVYQEGEQRLKFYGMFGFFAWQHTELNTMQNDAFVYGAGMAYHNKLWKVKWDMGGYVGYLEGDKPLVMRCEVDVPLYEKLLLRYQYENGLKDFPYVGHHLRLVYLF